MEKVKNALQHLKEKINAKLNQQPTAVTEEPSENQQNLVIVSDLAVAQGAQCNEPSGDEVQDRYYWIERDKLQSLFHQDRAGKNIPNYFLEQPTGIQPVFEDTFYHKLEVRGNLLTYNNEYVMFPQQLVDQALGERLTQLALKKVVVPTSEFGPLNYHMKQYGMETRQGIENASYYYQGNAYNARVDRQNQNTPLQWFQIRPVMAEWDGDKIRCTDVLIADICYRQDKVLDDFKNSVSINHEIPLIYTKTPWSNEINDNTDELQK